MGCSTQLDDLTVRDLFPGHLSQELCIHDSMRAMETAVTDYLRSDGETVQGSNPSVPVPSCVWCTLVA